MNDEELVFVSEEQEKISEDSQSFISRFEKLLKKYKRIKRKGAKLSKQEEEILEFLNANIDPSQIIAFKTENIAKSSSIILYSIILGLLLSGFNVINILFMLLGSVILFLSIYYVIVNVLPIVKELEKMYSYREAINFVQFLVMKLRLNPNLENALTFASRYVNGSLGRDITKKVNEMQYQGTVTAVDVLDYITNKWGDEIPGFKASLNLIKASIIEKQKARREELLDSSIKELSDNIYIEISRKIKGLKQPSMALFYLGVLLPVLLSILYPILVFTPMSMLATKTFAVSLFWFILPALLIMFIIFLIIQRPIIYFIEENETNVNIKLFLLVFVFVATVSLILGNFINSKLLSLLPLAIIGLFGFFKLKKSTDKEIEVINKIKKIEEEFPSTLYLMATKLNQGRPLEEAIGYVVEELPNYEITKLLYSKIYEIFSRTGVTLDSLMEGSFGKIEELEKSLVIRNGLYILMEASKMGSRTSASVATSIINQISTIRKTNELIDNLFSEIAGAMKFLSVFVAPFSLGIVSGLYGISMRIVSNISRAFKGTGTSSALLSAMLGFSFTPKHVKKIPSPGFMAMVLGIYTIIVVILMTFYSKYIEDGPTSSIILNNIGKNLIISCVVYCLGVIVGSSILG